MNLKGIPRIMKRVDMIDVWVYLYKFPVYGLRLIESGDWLKLDEKSK